MEKESQPELPGSGPGTVVHNEDGSYAIWPDALPVPAGWTRAWGPDTPDGCRAAVGRLAPLHGPRPEGRGGYGPTVPALFRHQAHRTPDALAVHSDDRQLTYRELDRLSDRLATGLRRHGAGAETVVAVCLERAAPLLVALLGVLKSGAAVLPLDPDHPSQRLRQLTEAAGAALLLADPDALDGLSADGPPPPGPRPDDLAYLIYTSGTTGTPKGVPVDHRAFALSLTRVAEAYGLAPADRVLQLGALGFDTALEQIFAPLLSGAAVVLGGRHTWAPIELAHRIPELGITVADLTPAYAHRLLDLLPEGGPGGPRLRLLIVGGDTVHAEDCRTALRRLPGTRLINAYGLTETAITSTLCELHADLISDLSHAPVPVGRPLVGTYAHVLDAALNPVPPGRKGEVYLGGPGLARGYWRSPVITAERFLPDPYAGRPGERMYRTGDTGRWRPDGNLELLGRIDDQVKIRGFRVDPTEIEAVLVTHPAVGQARVLAVDGTGAGRTLTAYHTGPATSGAELRDYLAERLPDPLVPAAFVAVEQMPLTPGGKIDNRRLTQLARPAATSHAGNGSVAAEHGLAYLWAQLLGVEEVAAEDDFFELGGNSLLAMEMLARARIMFGLGVDRIRELTRALLGDPTLGSFTAAVHTARTGAAPDPDATPDFTAEAELGVPVRKTDGDPDRADPAEILLTGATGFCGAHLLHALLTGTRARIHCLVRAPDPEHARERLRAAHQRYLHRDLHAPDRVVPLVGDLAEPLLGLPRARFEDLAGRLDAIHHLGGQVNFLYPYPQLRAANVGGTREVVRLAGHSRGIPVHYLSSMAVLAGQGAAGRRHVEEATPLDHPELLSVGYVESKWAAEALLHNAARAGLPVIINRVNDVTGDLATGTMNPGTELCALIRYFTDSGTVPDVDLPLDFVPADTFTRALTHLAAHAPADGRVHHLTNPRPAGLPQLADRIRAHGWTVDRLPYTPWVERLVAFAAEHPEHPITPFAPLFVDRCAGPARLTISEMYFRPTFPTFTRTNAESGLAGSGIEFPPVDGDLLDFYLDRMTANGQLAPAP